MKTLLLVFLCASTASAEQWCLSHTGRLRLRSAVCRPTERPFTMPTPADVEGRCGAKSPAVVDRDGELVGYLTGFTVGDANLIFRAVGLDTLGLPVDRAGLVPAFGNLTLYFSEPGCTGAPLIQDTNTLMKPVAVWPDVAWYATGDATTQTPGSQVFPPLPTYLCSDFGGVDLTDGFCCIPNTIEGAFYPATRFALDAAGLEPPFRLSMEP